MSEERKCPALADLWRFLRLDKPLPDDFVKHAAACNQCLFWTSHALAVLHAVRATFNRLILDNDCPSNDTVIALLLNEISKAGGQEPLSKIADIFLENSGKLRDAERHVNRDAPEHCLYCAMYYENTSEFAIELQKRYESRLLKGGEIRPTVENKSEIIRADDFRYDSKKKPD